MPLLPHLAAPQPPMHATHPSPQAPTALTCCTDAPLMRAHHANMLPPTLMREAIGQPPLYKDGEPFVETCSFDAEPLFSVMFPMVPHTEVTAKGDIVYLEVVCENVWKLEAYVEEMASGDTIPSNINIQKVRTS